MKRFGLVFLFLLTLAVAAYAVLAYSLLPLSSVVHPDMRASYLKHRYGIYTLVFAAAVALFLGAFQFWARLRQRRFGDTGGCALGTGAGPHRPWRGFHCAGPVTLQGEGIILVCGQQGLSLAVGVIRRGNGDAG